MEDKTKEIVNDMISKNEIEIEKLNNELLLADEKRQEEINNELKSLYKEKRGLLSVLSDFGSLNKVRIWVFIYGVLQVIISSPLAIIIWSSIHSVLIDKLTPTIYQISINSSPAAAGTFLAFLYYLFPFLNIFLSWFLWAFVVRKSVRAENKTFICFWIIQGVLTLVLMVVMLFYLILPALRV